MWRLIAAGNGFRWDISGYVQPQYEAGAHHMLMAMREGLEANGYEVTVTMSLQTEVEL